MSKANFPIPYAIHVQTDEYGCSVDKAILALDPCLVPGADCFTVTECKQKLDFATFSPVSVKLPRQVIAIWLQCPRRSS